MFKKFINWAKEDYIRFAYFSACVLLFLFFTGLFSFYILQSDDYYYSTFWKGGLPGFVRLTVDHFKSFNGRWLVHFFVQTLLSLPKLFLTMTSSLTLLFTGVLSFKVSQWDKSAKHCCIYIILFYCLTMLFGSSVLRESIMWASGFYNYVFPALLTFAALYLCKKGSKWCYALCFLSGATTEQWGITAFVMILLQLYFTLPPRVNAKDKSLHFMPAAFALLGYGTIYLSPATVSRIFTSGNTELSYTLIDLPRLSGIFFTKNSCSLIILIFIITTLIYAYFKKGDFVILYSGVLPLSLILLLPFHKSYTAAFVVFAVYLAICTALFFLQKMGNISTLLTGSMIAMLIMLPTNTFEARITFPSVFLLSLAAINIVFEFKISQKHILPSVMAICVVSLVFFAPSYMGFMKNSMLDEANLKAIKEAQDTNILHYNIDYDKRFAMRQMFNDGWFFNEFLSLYSLEDCTVIIESQNSVSFDSVKTKGLEYEGGIYIPVRALLEEKGGNITQADNITMTLNNKSLTYQDGVLTYENSQGNTVYLNADENRITDFYTLYIKLEVINDALNLNIKEALH